MNFPKHIRNVPENGQAIAPYNFVELPDKVVTVSPESLPQENRYYSQTEKRYTGRIECILTTESPLYIRCGLTTEEFRQNKESKDLPEFFYTNPLEKATQPVVPGSSLRGMLRNLVEIVSFSKIDRVSGESRLFFRNVAENHKYDSQAKEYKKYVEPKNIQAGYLKRDSKGWYIHPAKKINGETFVWVKEKDITGLSGFLKFNDPKYHPQYLDVSFDTTYWDSKRRKKFAVNVAQLSICPNQAMLVTSGNMKQDKEPSPRRHHCLVFEPNTNQELRIDKIAFEHYCNALTDFQKDKPFNENTGVFKEDRPIFYHHDNDRKKIGFFGQSPNFRIPYSPEETGHATTVVDFIPKELKNSQFVDLANAIFGFVRQRENDDKQANTKNKKDNREQSRSGRIFVSDAKYKTDKDGIWYKGNSEETVTPQILASPKPTTFQHYLVQPKETGARKSDLKHYASKPVEETVIRGHKLYWHKGNYQGSSPQIEHPNPSEASDTQLTQIKPIKPEVTFEFTIHFENLTNVELGALMWVLNIAQDENYRLKLGMGKPLGMGAIKIEHKLYLSDRQERYTKLFNGAQWETAEKLEDDPPYHQDFENYILEQIRQTGKFEEIPRIQMLLEMLRWPGPAKIKTRYMEIERDTSKEDYLGKKPKSKDKKDEYEERLVLPTPLQVMGIELEDCLTSSSVDSTSPKKLSQKFSQGQEVNAKVIYIERKSIQKGKKTQLRTIINYQIEGSDCRATEKVNKQEVNLTIGTIVKVRIEKVKNSSVRKVKRVEQS